MATIEGNKKRITTKLKYYNNNKKVINHPKEIKMRFMANIYLVSATEAKI